MTTPTTACHLCDGPAVIGSMPAPSGGIYAAETVNCETCGDYAISLSAIDLLKLKPQAKGSLREEIGHLRSETTPRPLIKQDMVDWCALNSRLR